ncbi:sporulation protein YqfD [Oceanobacillus halophilus]|uniref:Sporulation protein YqfD n=1 Tax=Oceanobacillus halophilus TaxID=930130 RepID=A0A495AGU8_9BACI|nr:sporulation protein YqfD [Oceanobacillus halophilus]RKQ37825.1 sporulation protein YqfD [Oceanobacillus halophilus]
MRQVQGAFITGYVTILIKGKHPELFFQQCTRNGITVWDIRKIAEDSCEGNIKLSDVKKTRKLIRRTHFKLSFVKKKGYPFFYKRFMNKKPLLIALLLSFILAIFLSNILWKIEITGVPKEIEEKIEKQLDTYGIHRGTWIFSLDSPNTIQQKLVEDVPELLWVGVDQKGTTYYLEGVEKVIVKEAEKNQPRNLIATKKGVIKRMYVAKGLPMVQVNDYVEPGDLLVSGEIGASEDSEEEDEDDKEESRVDYVAAEGEITGQTWYEVKVTIPLEYDYEELTGNKEKKYFIKVGDFQLPIWGFGNPSFENVHYESTENPINLLKWELPLSIVDTVISEKIYQKGKRTKEEAIQAGIEQARSDLLLELGPEAKILSEKVLHESNERGKVKLNLYLTVEENIASVQPISQGD